ncbi:MAG: hypothetical protein UT61_C0010G0012 [Candidatus Woesebacteria bacterium GW2011_GWA1_39_8]|jgi:hypothetical protein|uniref:Uncharacterized protein n=1 Tax=Candidatus Woesebacteria bacterium GW2011_GWA1_39_8 TaxID=1618552 RepID=A0A0G0PQ09_9BACT|nr:MAG: hypothetical protein UT61_C0010G0012 [Candidatus Woesebacteria bacterium GW2011_GWA1_39_8]
MRKEVIFAIFAGILFGLVIAFGVWRTNTALKSREGNAIQTENADSQILVKNQDGLTELTLSLAKPQQNDVFVQSPVEISGVTKPNVWVVISSENDDYLLKSDETGAFTDNIELVSGTNLITVFAIDDAGKTVNQSLNLVYSTEFAENTSLSQ